MNDSGIFDELVNGALAGPGTEPIGRLGGAVRGRRDQTRQLRALHPRTQGGRDGDRDRERFYAGRSSPRSSR